MKSLFLFGALLAAAAAARDPSSIQDDGKPWPEAQFEVFRMAPGRQEAFIRKLAQWDEVSAAGGQPAAQMFIHEDGEDWDVLLFKPFPKTPITTTQQAAMDAKAGRMHLKTGPAFFLEIRQNLASHTETKALGPLSAAQWLGRLDAWRAAHPEAAEGQ
jgi:hypothetical protein